MADTRSGGRFPQWGELVVATSSGGETHTAHRYPSDGAIFALCGLHEGLEPTDPGTPVHCRRCRVGTAGALRDFLQRLSELNAEAEYVCDRIEFLRRALDG